ncbi:putative SP-containing protein [Vairimorpha necatrix]|uniref:SP-containing protein n=1 Tax=Vairimorpha necatrix TaxID=6039 RepID=A0AAX4JCS7_9MICR
MIFSMFFLFTFQSTSLTSTSDLNVPSYIDDYLESAIHDRILLSNYDHILRLTYHNLKWLSHTNKIGVRYYLMSFDEISKNFIQYDDLKQIFFQSNVTSEYKKFYMDVYQRLQLGNVSLASLDEFTNNFKQPLIFPLKNIPASDILYEDVNRKILEDIKRINDLIEIYCGFIYKVRSIYFYFKTGITKQ